MAHRENLSIRSNHGIGAEPLSEPPDHLLALLPRQAPPPGVVEKHDLRAAMVMHNPTIGKQVIDDLKADASLLHANPGVLGESGGVHAVQLMYGGSSGGEPDSGASDEILRKFTGSTVPLAHPVSLAGSTLT